MKASPVPSRATLPVPFDYATAQANPNWRRELAWPIGHVPLRDAVLSRQKEFLVFAAGLEADRRRVALLAGGRLLAMSAALIEAALIVEAEHDFGLAIIGGPPELDWLRGIGDAIPETFQRRDPREAELSFAFLRQAARIRSWTPLYRLPAALFSPAATAVTHNPMLREAAEKSGRPIGFVHADFLMQSARRLHAKEIPTDDLVAGAVAVVSDVPALTPTTRKRLRALIEPRTRALFGEAAQDLACLAMMKKLPLEIWSGSGGYHASRALGLEVARRGGQAIRFDHGGSTGMNSAPEPLIMRELSVSTRFVATTAAVADLCRRQTATSVVAGLACEIVGGHGDPHYHQSLHLPRRTPRARSRLVYASGAAVGFRQVIPPVLRDPVMIDWQLRLAEMLLAMPLDVVLRPHPEGIFRGKPHPLSALAPVPDASFEELMADADIFLFDYPFSTAFWAALCSDRPVVLVDLGLAQFGPEIQLAVNRRCTIVAAEYGADNLPRVVPGKLAAAISTAAASRPDPTEFRMLMLGHS